MNLLATVTFNPNQVRAHLLPLVSLDEVTSIILVADHAPPPLPKVHPVVPTAFARRALGRAGAKLALCVRLARKRHFDWVLGFNFVPHGFNAQLVARKAGTRSMYHMIGGEREWLGGGYSSDNGVLGRLPRPSQRLERLMLGEMRKATLIVTMGPRMRERMLARGFPAEQVAVVPPSTDVERFVPRPRGNPSFDVVAVAALLQNKGLSDLIDAVALLRDRHSDLRVGIAGEGPLRGALEQRARGVGVQENVTFLGQVAEIESVYAGASAFVLCSRSEGLPVSMLDAMAAGVVPVVTDVGEISTLVVDGRNGLLYPTGDVAALAQSIHAVVSDRDRARRLAAQAREDVVAHHSIEAVSAVYRRLLCATDEL